ncbi:MAG: hypothetical protein A3C50_02995 [Candidatus Staskawiczbacteria bacterium RIFCSPHIGHO2_02_FULL_43_16]|uniref:Uncharacterized protein n=1 Tax=Candidatus Staskawiczbacteria bacterium RIFCSPHIGHO2_01_FULL_41_41 TaxID=1802203 RepID=A0A1G2HTI5_9BACT|nr:MAG: hypothetical protein A2822_01100 [Candidatus Staskawiczbacteria bacterium RIFCSPHIGHO2_01_FULL_41_41]OGZ68582.1 MAG: hypothetical protein A3C50_02995 [Candidatus Staskawiczbacteria bacterium RIFCSPHIGHO2_02_FULL_43_16]
MSERSSGESQEPIQEKEKVVRKTIKELLAEQAESLVPTEGDEAYTVYAGKEYVGVLKKYGNGGWAIVPANGEKYFESKEGYVVQKPGGAAYQATESLDTANVSVYSPDEYAMNSEEDDSTLKKFNLGVSKRVQYDSTRGAFYLRAQED